MVSLLKKIRFRRPPQAFSQDILVKHKEKRNVCAQKPLQPLERNVSDVIAYNRCNVIDFLIT